MNDEPKFRYDPLYRVIDETEEMRFIEGNFKPFFDRLKQISNLGLVTEVFEMAKYPKYEHSLGTVHQINSLLDVNKKAIPERYLLPLRIASLFLHLGHFPFTYSTERALLLACNTDNRNHENEIKQRVKKTIDAVLNKIELDETEKESIMENLFSIKGYHDLYKYYSSKLLIDKFSKIKSKFNLGEDSLKIILKDIIYPEDDGYKFLRLADKADFVQRDALYFGTVKLDIAPRHLYRNISAYDPRFSISEEKLIESNLVYISERFYNNYKVISFSRLYEKILAGLIISKNFDLKWLEEYNDEKFKRLITEDLDEENKRKRLPSKWVERAKSLFEQKFEFDHVLKIKGICFPEEMDILDIEYKLIGKNPTRAGMLEYPFEEKILLDIDYEENYKYPTFRNHRVFSINLFQDRTTKNPIRLLKFIKTISPIMPLQNAEEIRNVLAKNLSKTNKFRFKNDAIIKIIVDSIIEIEKSKGLDVGTSLVKYEKIILGLKTFKGLWASFESFSTIFEFSFHIEELKKPDERIKDEDYRNILENFVKGFLSLPVKLLQFNQN